MLELKEIRKEYRTGSLVQRALDSVSLNLRDNEFVAILGPSGSGKTTLLNIIGGLDRYDSGDLIINGVSTKRYKDRDWDSYRNHTIGFVFQSYNLIPHQTLLANVELALTISGVSRKERRERALEALSRVGLAEQSHKKPNQLSGGQMQRVAIARALVNNPDILLADEPTGALDTVTSVQVMDLLKEVAKDRLVVMVTHNPELAEQYANRIVRLKDGQIISDTNPFTPERGTFAPIHKNLGKAAMNFVTALGLSFNNLLTKKARTILVAFAGSIGIIGIALILALSNGANKYIKDTEEQTLSEYPLEITSTSISLASMLENNTSQTTGEAVDGKVTEVSAVSDIFAMFGSNDLASLRDYLEEESDIYSYARAVEYTYDLTPRIYSVNEEEESVRQVNPNNDFESIGLGSDNFMMSMSSMASMNVFFELPSESSLYSGQYDVVAGRWPESTNECVLVLSASGAVSDYMIYTFNLKDPDELLQMIEDFSEGETVTESSSEDEGNNLWDYDDFLGYTFKVLGAWETYVYDDSMGFYVDKSSDGNFMYDTVTEDGRDLTVVGIVQPSADADIYMLSDGIYYYSGLVEELINDAADSQIVKDQLADESINVLTGESFDSEEDSLDFTSLFTINEEKISEAFVFDEDALSIDSGMFDDIDLSHLDLAGAISSAIPSLTTSDISSMVSSVDLDIDSEAMTQLTSNILSGYITYAASDPTTNYAALPTALTLYLNSEEGQGVISQLAAAYAIASSGDTTMTPEQITALTQALVDGYSQYAAENSLPDPAAFEQSFNDYINQPDVQTMINEGIANAIDEEQLQNQLSSAMSSYTDRASASIESALREVLNKLGNQIASQIENSISESMSGIGDAISIDEEKFAEAFELNMDQSEMEAMIVQLMSGSENSAASNLEAFGYIDPDDLSSITIYPKDFEAKESITDIIDEYNASVDDNHKIAYTDIVGTIMSSVTNIVDAISYVLVAFVSISLVVSSIMIGVITYISVLERRKEIGILRAMGASKHNISEVFNAETFITGLLAGLLGVSVSLLTLIPTNLILRYVTGISNITAYLSVKESVLLVLLSVVLTLIGGLIPSSKAAKSDPVTALRTE